MAAQPVRGDQCTWELLAVHKAAEAPPCTDGHPADVYRIYAAVIHDNGTMGVARVDHALCAEGLASFLRRYNR